MYRKNSVYTEKSRHVAYTELSWAKPNLTGPNNSLLG